MFHFSKAIFDTSFRPFAVVVFFLEKELFCTNGKRDSGTKFSNPFVYHLPKLRTDRFARVNS